MSMDIHHFLRKHDLNNVQLLGHSMGGKVAMSYALSEEVEKDGRLEKLVVADIAPSQGRIGQEFTDYVKAMKEIGERGLKTRKEAQHALSQVEPVGRVWCSSIPEDR
jgi:pimeloyl-ACP methyl ester carboxylesterase